MIYAKLITINEISLDGLCFDCGISPGLNDGTILICVAFDQLSNHSFVLVGQRRKNPYQFVSNPPPKNPASPAFSIHDPPCVPVPWIY